MPDNNLPGPLNSLASQNPYLAQLLDGEIKATGQPLTDAQIARQTAQDELVGALGNDPRLGRTPLQGGLASMGLAPGNATGNDMLVAFNRGVLGQEAYLTDTRAKNAQLVRDYQDTIVKELEARRKAALQAAAQLYRAQNTRGAMGQWKLGSDKASGRAFMVNSATGETRFLSDSQSAAIQSMIPRFFDQIMARGDITDTNMAWQAAAEMAANTVAASAGYQTPSPQQPGAQMLSPGALPPTEEVAPESAPAQLTPLEQQLQQLKAKRDAATDMGERDRLNQQMVQLTRNGGFNADFTPPQQYQEPPPVPHLPIKQPETQASRELMGKTWGEQYKKYKEAQADFESMKSNLDRMENMTANGETFSGPVADIAAKFGSLIAYVDPENSLAKKASSGEEYFKMLAEMTRKKIKQLGANPSNSDLLFTMKSFPQLTNTAQGRMQALGALKADLILANEQANGFIKHFENSNGNMRGYSTVKDYPLLAVLPQMVVSNGKTIWKFKPITFEQYRAKHLAKNPKDSPAKVISAWKDFIVRGGR